MTEQETDHTHRSSKTIPLWGTVVDFGDGEEKRGLSIRSSDCEDIVPPTFVNEKHRELQDEITRDAVKDGERQGWIRHDGEKITEWHVDEELLEQP